MDNDSGKADQNLAAQSTEMKPISGLSASFTPGPWEVQQLNHADGELWLQIGWKDSRGNSYGPIAELKYLVTPEIEQRANARLIAAAPALYDAAQVTISILTDKDGDPRDAVIFLQQAVGLVAEQQT